MSWLTVLVDLIYPRRCAVCEADLSPQSPGYICKGCREELLEEDVVMRCPRCGIGVGKAAMAVGDCTYCRSMNFEFDRGIAVGSYKGKLRDLLIDLKLHRRPFLAGALSGLLAEKIKGAGLADEVDCVTYVPKSIFGRITRGFNQAEILAQKLSRVMKLPLAKGVLVRSALSRSQRYFSGKDRIKNVRGAFRVRDARCVKEKNVLLVDNVLTTGATANECAKVLKRAGARSVFVAIVARTDLNSDR